MSLKTVVLSAAMAAMASAASVNFVNNSTQPLPWIVIGQTSYNETSVLAGPGTLNPGDPAQSLPIGAVGVGVSLQMGAPGTDPTTYNNGIFEVQWVNETDALDYFMSCGNCLQDGPGSGSPNDDPLINFTRSVDPTQPGNGGRCISFSIGPNDDYDIDNVYPPAGSDNEPIGTCNFTDDVVITFTVST